MTKLSKSRTDFKLDLDYLDKDKLYYLASPYTAKDITSFNKAYELECEREEAITLIAGELIKDYSLMLITPITTSHRISELTEGIGTGWEHWKKLDEHLISKCDGLIVCKLDGWEQSVGVCAERLYCLLNDIPIYYLDPDTMELELGESAENS